MSLHNQLQNHKLFIEDSLQELLADFAEQTKDLPLAKETQGKLVSMLFGGKMIRGSLICLIYQFLSQKKSIPKAVYYLAAAEEIFASALLVHDDVMDRDRVRRGRASVFAQYETEAEKLTHDAEHYGYSQAIMLGDICFFWVQKILANLDTTKLGDMDGRMRAELFNILARESIRTGLGQMLDVNAAMLKIDLSEDQIQSISLNKTARYTCVLPFLLGATAAGAEPATLQTLEKLGNTIGILFQIKDDELGLFGTEEQTGKPEGNDVKEGKQTLFYYFTKELLTGNDRDIFLTIYGTAVTTEELTTVRNLVQSSGAFDKVQARLQEYASFTRELIAQLPINDSEKNNLHDFVEFNLQRKR